MNEPGALHVEGFFDEPTSTVSYLVLDRSSRACALIDTVLDFDAASGRTGQRGADRLLARVQALDGQVAWILETHAHADHLTAAALLRERTGGRVAIGAGIVRVQQTFGELFNLGPAFPRDGSQFDRLLSDGDTLPLGTLQVRALHTPGHTPACMTYLIEDGSQRAAFAGDTLFMPDYGTARCDFPGGDAATLYRSIQRILALPEDTRLYMCHDYQPGGRPVRYACSVAEQRSGNVHLAGCDEATFVSMREARDATLAMPALILPSLQVNMRAGSFPPAEDNGVSYLKLPLNRL